MNANIKMAYLSRAATSVFGPNFGGATVQTNVRAGYTTECPNVGKLINNMVFSLKMENEIMGKILKTAPSRRPPRPNGSRPIRTPRRRGLPA